MSAFPSFDLAYWQSVFPWKDVNSYFEMYARSSRVTPKYVTSPVDVVIAEELRANKASGLLTRNSFPVDVFAFAIGEPENPATTKIGGIPFRNPGKPWPTNDGKPFTFIAQFNFSDSRDIAGATPGDILLVYALDEFFCDLHFEWTDLSIGAPLPSAFSPASEFEFQPCYGVRHRTVDYEKDEALSRAEIDILRATKIGGLPAFNGFQAELQDDARSIGETSGWVSDLREVVPGRYLCTLGPVSPRLNIAYPWCNHAAPYTLDNRPDTLTLVDMGKLFLCLDGDGSLHYYFECG